MLKEFPYDREYKVVVNYEEEYSILPAGEVSAGWKEVDRSGNKKVCLATIEEVWTIMRPLSLHSRMAEDIRRLRYRSNAETGNLNAGS